MVREVIPGQGVDQDREIIPMLVQPGNKAVEVFRSKCNLTTPTWMRTDQLFMEPPNQQAELFTAGLAKGAGLILRRFVKVDVGVVRLMVIDRIIRSAHQPSLLRMAPRLIL